MNKIKLNIFRVVVNVINIVIDKTINAKYNYTSNCNSYSVFIDRMLINIIDFEKTMYRYFKKRYSKMYKEAIAKEFGLPNEKEEDLGI